MFEKEAEEYIKEHTFFDEEFGLTSLDVTSKTAFQEGAKFGYNKANEWHKQEVDDIYDFISEDWSIRYFVCIMKDKNRVTAIGNCDEDYDGGVSVNLFFDHDDSKYHIDDIVWWKEIVLPELKETE